MESELECVIACPACHKSFDSVFEVVTGKSEVHDWKCPDGQCDGTFLLAVGTCHRCGMPMYRPGAGDGAMECDPCRNGVTALAKLIREIQADVKDPVTAKLIVEALMQRDAAFDKSLEELNQSIARVRQNIDSVNAAVSKSQAYVREDVKESEARLLTQIKEAATQAGASAASLTKYVSELPIGELTREERQAIVEHVRGAVIGRKKLKDGSIVPRYKDVTDLVSQLLKEQVTEPMRLLDRKMEKVKHEIASVVAETVTEKTPLGKSRGKDDRQLVLSLNLPAMSEFVQAANSLALSTVVARLPELFNRIEVDLRHHQHEKRSSGAEHVSPTLQLLQDLDAYFVNWQRQNNIIRFPEQPGEAIVPRLHDVVRTVSTDNRDQHRLIAHVDQFGYVLQQGDNEVVLQKAEVAVWDSGKRD